MTSVEWPGSAASEYRHVDEIARLTRERDAAYSECLALEKRLYAWKQAAHDNGKAADIYARERDAAIAQRDRAVAAGSAVWDAWHNGYNPGKKIVALAAALDDIASTPIPDRLAAEPSKSAEEYFEVFLRDYPDLSPIKHKPAEGGA